MSSFNAMEDINVLFIRKDLLFVVGLPVNTVVRLFSVDGRLLKMIQTSAQQTQLQGRDFLVFCLLIICKYIKVDCFFSQLFVVLRMI